MRIVLRLVVFVSVFLGVFYFRRANRKPQTAKPPIPVSQADLAKATELPGNPVTVRLGRAALDVEGDAADPIEDVQLFRVGEPEQKVEFTGGFQSPTRAIWFFDLDPKATYRAEIKTLYRKETRELHGDKVEPIEVLRVRSRVSAGMPIGAAFSPDCEWFATATDTGSL